MRIKFKTSSILLLAAFIIILALIPIRSQMIKLIDRMNNYLPQNLYIDDHLIGGMTLKEAVAKVNLLEAEQLKKQITIQYNDGAATQQKYSFTYGNLGYFADKSPIIDELHNIMNKNTGLLKRVLRYKEIENSRGELKLSYGIYYDRFLKALERFNDSALSAPIDAYYRFEDGKAIIVPEVSGNTFDKDGLFKALIANHNQTTATLNVIEAMPAITAAQLEEQGIKELMSGFTTRFDAGNVPRSSNIRLAAKLIDGSVLAPNEEFSFNQVVGERTEDRGFKEAGVYINGRVDTGIGGGICQVSTTLYNAVLIADLEVKERSNHSLTVPYVPLSRDAAVSWGVTDFKFVNNTENYIFVHCKTTASSITFELYSRKTNKKVELVSTTLSKVEAPIIYVNDASIPVGKETIMEKGHDAFQSQLIKHVYVDGIKISTEVISKDKYLSAARIIKRGTKMTEGILNLEDEL